MSCDQASNSPKRARKLSTLPSSYITVQIAPVTVGPAVRQLFSNESVDNDGNQNGCMRFAMNTAYSTEHPFHIVGSVCRINAPSVQWVIFNMSGTVVSMNS